MTIEDMRALAQHAILEDCHWVTEWDAGIDLCRTCAKFVVAALHECGEVEATVDGGPWASGESDNPRACYRCRTPIRYSLTKEGMQSEIAHFVQNGMPMKPSPLQAYEICALEEAIECSDFSWSDDYQQPLAQPPEGE